MKEIKSMNYGCRVRKYLTELGRIATRGFAIGFGVGVPVLILGIAWAHFVGSELPDLVLVALIVAAATQART